MTKSQYLVLKGIVSHIFNLRFFQQLPPPPVVDIRIQNKNWTDFLSNVNEKDELKHECIVREHSQCCLLRIIFT
jgi:hypothetical protein